MFLFRWARRGSRVYQGEVSGKFRNAARNRCNRYNELRVASWPRRFRRELVTPIEPARDRRPGILIFLARGEETVRRGRFMRKVADDSAEREREREFLVQFSRRAGRGRKRKTTWREFGKNGMTRNPRRCARLFRAMYYTYACVARENGRGEWKRSSPCWQTPRGK